MNARNKHDRAKAYIALAKENICRVKKAYGKPVKIKLLAITAECRREAARFLAA